ncbi:DUF5363 domain-containing protein [Caviibacterium pharyngocola]|uniref:DUF5363 domain-containing protein n=1 Tax=Caviibacterium pharyngocola TaxID=28159 RepID=UPI0013FDB83D|nr:DUF5363 domain-containing protein [Caviibacterium pharyngocola]
MSETKKGWFKKALAKYDQFCKELGIDQGACRSCVPVVKFDENATDKPAQKTSEKARKM